MSLEIITCPQWGARPPKRDIVLVKKSVRIIIHHTAGHHREIRDPANESLDELVRYARDIQAYHMRPGGLGVPSGGIDSGHNFLVGRNGRVLQGRWMTVSAIEHGHMVESAHCPGQNMNIGIEHEHKGDEPMTPQQREASAQLIAWISLKYGRKIPLPLAPHKKYYKTSCPANLVNDIPKLSTRARELML